MERGTQCNAVRQKNGDMAYMAETQIQNFVKENISEMGHLKDLEEGRRITLTWALEK
jgi:hypothetical protein